MNVSDLIDATVHDQDGRRCGRVTEVRAHTPPGGPPRVTELLLGPHGLHRRLTGRGTATHTVRFDRVELRAPGRLHTHTYHITPLTPGAEP